MKQNLIDKRSNDIPAETLPKKKILNSKSANYISSSLKNARISFESITLERF